jgi:two-component system, OmpR family, response regulator
LKGPLGPTHRILLVEDDADLAAIIAAELEANGHQVNAASIADAMSIARANGADILILDRSDARSDSLQLLESLRNQGVKIPVLIISALSSTEEVVRGLKVGADDYLPKPFHMTELVAKVDALIRRLGGVQTTRLTVGDIEIDLINRTVVVQSGAGITLLPAEFRLLEYFLRHSDQLVTREMLARDVWQIELEVGNNVIDVQISNLRRKIDERGRPSRIANVRGQGFILCPRMP